MLDRAYSSEAAWAQTLDSARSRIAVKDLGTRVAGQQSLLLPSGPRSKLDDMDFDAVKKHFRPLSPEEADAIARKHGSGIESAVELADVYPPEVVVDPGIMGGPP